MAPETIPQALLDAYCATEYRIFTPAGTIVLKLDTRSDPLRDLLQAHGVASCAFLTAYNPGSRPTPDEENRRSQSRLEARVKRNWKYLQGEGFDPGGQWPAEPSLLILGIGIDAATGLSRAFGQNAFLFADADGNIRLIPGLQIREDQ